MFRGDTSLIDRPITAPLLGFAVAFVIIIGFAGARSYATSVPLLFLALIVAAPPAARSALSGARQSPFLACTLLYLAWAALCSTWTSVHLSDLQKALILALILSSAWATVTIAVSSTSRFPVDELRGLRVAFALGATYLFADYHTDGWVWQALTALNLNKLPAEFTRRATSVPLLLGPLIASLVWLRYGVSTRLVLSIGPLLGLGAAFASPHETAMIAVVALCAATGLGYLLRTWIHWLMTAAWLTCCLAIIPLSIALHGIGLAEVKWLPESATDRILIWDGYARKSLTSPLVGHGASLAVRKSVRIESFEKAVAKRRHADEASFTLLTAHPHNIYLQNWHELGAIGAILFAAIGVTLLNAIRSLPMYARPLSYGAFAAGAAQMVSSYSIWQYWFVCLLCLSGALLSLVFSASQAQRNEERRDDPAG